VGSVEPSKAVSSSKILCMNALQNFRLQP